jgi:hypothetical protein
MVCILALLGNCFGYLKKIGNFCSKSSGHPGCTALEVNQNEVLYKLKVFE